MAWNSLVIEENGYTDWLTDEWTDVKVHNALLFAYIQTWKWKQLSYDHWTPRGLELGICSLTFFVFNTKQKKMPDLQKVWKFDLKMISVWAYGNFPFYVLNSKKRTVGLSCMFIPCASACLLAHLLSHLLISTTSSIASVIRFQPSLSNFCMSKRSPT